MESEHFKQAVEDISYAIATRPQIVSTEIPGMDGWGVMGEVAPREP